mmetsp:Transcript_30369/g.50260  ORF Transcript_30369/g.50260 Transcript_30369/m.50260 type:complete len:477 (-) Transcript_30369:241-1671(-)
MMDSFDVRETLRLAQSIPPMPSLDQLESLMDFDADSFFGEEEITLPDLDEVQELLGIDVLEDDVFGSVLNKAKQKSKPAQIKEDIDLDDEPKDFPAKELLAAIGPSKASDHLKLPSPAEIKLSDNSIHPIPLVQQTEKGQSKKKGKQCYCCESKATHGPPGGKALSCEEHKSADMVRLKRSKKPDGGASQVYLVCQNTTCSKSATHGQPGTIPLHCKKHAMAGSTNIGKMPAVNGQPKKEMPTSDLFSQPMHQAFAQMMAGLMPFPYAFANMQAAAAAVNPKVSKIAPVSSGGTPLLPKDADGSQVSQKRKLPGRASGEATPNQSKKQNMQIPDPAMLARMTSFSDPKAPLEDVSKLPLYGGDNASLSIKPMDKPSPSSVVVPDDPATPEGTSPDRETKGAAPPSGEMQSFLIEKGLEAVAATVCEAYENDLQVLAFSAEDREQFDQDLSALGVKLYHRRKLLMLLKDLNRANGKI